MALAALLLLLSFVIFVIAVVITAVRTRTVAWTDLGLALLTLALILERSIL